MKTDRYDFGQDGEAMIHGKVNYKQENLTFEHPKFEYKLKFGIKGI